MTYTWNVVITSNPTMPNSVSNTLPSSCVTFDLVAGIYNFDFTPTEVGKFMFNISSGGLIPLNGPMAFTVLPG
jgi:hypothetical protein